jgi:hypothetical protein
MTKTIVSSAVKLLVVALAWVLGTLVGGAVTGLLGLPVPEIPAGADAGTVLLLTAVTGFLPALVLALLAAHLPGRWWERSLVLALFAWVAYSLNNYLETLLVTTMAAAGVYSLVMNVVASLLTGAAAAWLFRPAPAAAVPGAPTLAGHIAARLGTRPPAEWAWRLAAALAAFPVIYIFFGILVEPFVGPYYRSGQFMLRAPTWSEIIPMLVLRSALFVFICLPIVAVWRGSRRGLWVSLGLALFVLVGLVFMLLGYWYPLGMRVLHSLEILADSFVHAAALTWLLAPGLAAASRDGLPAPGRAAAVR